MPGAYKGEVWMTDLGIAAKVRPCLLLTDEPTDDELALFTVVHHTTSL
jgi:mRNA interferase MazF